MIFSLYNANVESFEALGNKMDTSWQGMDQLLVDKSRGGRQKVLCNVGKKLIQNVKYRRGQGLRRLAKRLKSRGLVGSKDTIVRYLTNIIVVSHN